MTMNDHEQPDDRHRPQRRRRSSRSRARRSTSTPSSKTFEDEERERLGLDGQARAVGRGHGRASASRRRERAKVTLLIGGLTVAQDYLIEGALKGLGYNVQMLDVPDQRRRFQAGKEFGNRGQCNPTYFTVGNLVKYLITLRDKHGMTAKDIVKKYVFLTAGACGPCRFGMYVTEYRKALRDAGFDGFRVMLFQQTGGLKQATGDEVGLELNPTFFMVDHEGASSPATCSTRIGYRIRPYEVEPGATERARSRRRRRSSTTALEQARTSCSALWKCKPIFAAVEVDKTPPEAEGQHHRRVLGDDDRGRRQLPAPGVPRERGRRVRHPARRRVAPLQLWEVPQRHARARATSASVDTAKYGLGGARPVRRRPEAARCGYGGDVGVRVALPGVRARGAASTATTCPTWTTIAEVSHDYYNNDLRGGEGHMEVGKLIMNVVHRRRT